MIDSVAAMAWDTMEFDDAFFLVALDTLTYELACTHGVPVVSMMPLHTPSDRMTRDKGEEALKDSVKHSKFTVAKQLLDLNIDLFFFEMDVLFTHSPQPLLSSQTVDFLVSSHQNNPRAGNIGLPEPSRPFATSLSLQGFIQSGRIKPHKGSSPTV